MSVLLFWAAFFETPQKTNKVSSQKNEQIKNMLEDVQHSLNGRGRILIRKSGTEDVVRLMVEHKEKNKLQETIDTCLSILKKKN